jgi:hypothetical protein
MKIFLSYGHDINSPLVERIADDLETHQHDVWIDRNRLKSGHDWRRKIVDGVKDSEIAFSCLSSHYVASEVCLDEMMIALAERSGNVHSILLQSSDEFQVPVALSHIQWLDMHDWSERQNADATAYETWYQSKLSEILRILDDPDTQRFAGEIGWLSDLLRPAPFATRMSELLSEEFFGRQWLLDDIESWRTAERRSKVFCITGEPGIGKSAIAAWLAHYGKTNVIAIHFCQHDHPAFASPARVIRSIACQMAARLPDYRRFVVESLQRELKPDDETDQRSALQRLDSYSAAELFDLLIAQASHFGLRGGRERYLVVIDALDEAGSELARFLAQKVSSLPDWLGFVVTSRPDEHSVRAHLAALSPTYLDASDSRNESDLQDAAQNWIKGFGLTDSEAGLALEKLLAASAGNFLYLTVLRRFYETDTQRLTMSDWDRLPPSLASLYGTYLTRACPDAEQYRATLAPMLSLLVAARAPLRQAFIQEALELDEEAFHLKVLQPLGSLLRRRGGCVELFHKTFADWLTNAESSNAYFVSRAKGQRSLGTAVFKLFRRSPNGLERLLAVAANCDRRLYLWAGTAPDPEASEVNQRLEQVKTLASNSIFATASRIKLNGPGGPARQTRKMLASGHLHGLLHARLESTGGCVEPDALLSDGAGGWVVCRLSASTAVSKPHDHRALAVQVYLLRAAGLNISGAQFVFIHKQFCLVDPSDFSGLFVTEDLSSIVLPLALEVSIWITEVQESLQDDEPETEPGKQCQGFARTCRYLETHCAPVRDPTAGDVGYPLTQFTGVSFKGEFVSRMHQQGVFDLRDVPEVDLPPNPVVHRIWRATKTGLPILEPSAGDKLAALPYPRYFLDFEILQEVIPRWVGTQPYMQIPFAWSCHREDAAGIVEHFEFLDLGGNDPRRGFVEALLKTVARVGTVFTYSPFERFVLKRLAEQLPDLEAEIDLLLAQLVDLLPIVRSHYYHPQMRGSFSLKAVLATLDIPRGQEEFEDLKDWLDALDVYQKILTLRTVQGASAEAESQRLVASIKRYAAIETLTLCQLARRLSGKPYL